MTIKPQNKMLSISSKVSLEEFMKLCLQENGGTLSNDFELELKLTSRLN